MRCIIKVTIPVETGNEAIRTGKLQKTMKGIIDELKPEAAYFFAIGPGRRGGIFVVDLKDTAQIPMVAEPFFLAFNADVQIMPVMNLEDLMKAGPHIETAVKKYA
jgi:hypothetical protein